MLRLFDHRQSQRGPGGRRPCLWQANRRGDQGQPRRARAAAATLPALGALRRRLGTALPISGHLRHRLRQVHRGCGATVQRDRNHHGVHELGGLPRGLEGKPRGIHQVRPGPPVPELLGVRGVPLRHRRRDQEGTTAQGRLPGHAGPNAVTHQGIGLMLELDDIQHILLTRTPAMTGRYEFLSFDETSGARAWLSELVDVVESAASVRETMDSTKRWVTLGFTWNGLRALGVPEDSLASFPDEFRQGMAARADILGDTGRNHPDNWGGGLAGDDLHAIAILFARDNDEHVRATAAHDALVSRCQGVRRLSYLDLNATPPFNYAHDHFGFRDRLSQPVIEGSGEVPTPGSGAPLKAGEFILGYPDEFGVTAVNPQPKMLARNGSYMAYRRLEEHVGKFRA